MRVKELLNILDDIAPLGSAESYDNPGLLVGAEDNEVSSVLLALDLTLNVLQEAIDKGVTTIITHHPLIFHGIKHIHTDNVEGKLLGGLIKNDINYIAMHTNFDKSEDGLNDYLCELIGLKDVCIMDEDGFGRIGILEKSISLNSFCQHIKTVLDVPVICHTGRGDKLIKKVGLCTGAGSSMYEQAAQLGLDAFITGDIKHNIGVLAAQSDTALIDGGHYGTEAIFKNIMGRHLQKRFNELQYNVNIIYSDTEKSPWSYV